MNAVVTRTAMVAMFVVAAVTGSVAQAPPLQPLPDQTAVAIRERAATQTLVSRAAEYATLHRLIEGLMAPLRPTTNVGEIRTSMQLLATRIQYVRVDAQQGDIITPEVARMFRHRIAACLTPEEWAAFFSENDVDEEGVPVPVPALRVNMEWPADVSFDFVPPQMLQALPALPPELEYRIIGRSLVLLDHHANLIADFLPRAFTT